MLEESKRQGYHPDLKGAGPCPGLERRGPILETLSEEHLQEFKMTDSVTGVKERKGSEWTDFNDD